MFLPLVSDPFLPPSRPARLTRSSASPSPNLTPRSAPSPEPSRTPRNSSGNGGGNRGGPSGPVGLLLSGCDNKLRGLATLITADDMAGCFTEDRLKELKEEIQRLSKMSATICHEEKETKRVIETELDRLKPHKQPRQDDSSSSASASSSSSSAANHNDNDGDTAASIMAAMAALIQKNSSAFDATTAATVKDIARLLGQVDDDDDVVVRELENDDTYKCPLTTARILEPVTNGACQHVASKAAVMNWLETALKNNKGKAEVKCFMSGCQAVWKLETVKEDCVFQDKMECYFRRQSQVRRGALPWHPLIFSSTLLSHLSLFPYPLLFSSTLLSHLSLFPQRNTIGAQSGNSNTIDLDDDDDNEYTQV